MARWLATSLPASVSANRLFTPLSPALPLNRLSVPLTYFYTTQGVTITPAEDNMRLWNVVIAGPVRSCLYVRPSVCPLTSFGAAAGWVG